MSVHIFNLVLQQTFWDAIDANQRYADTPLVRHATGKEDLTHFVGQKFQLSVAEARDVLRLAYEEIRL